jgi:hypothetical protein
MQSVELRQPSFSSAFDLPLIAAAFALSVGLVLIEDTSAKHDLVTLGLVSKLDAWHAIKYAHARLLLALRTYVFADLRIGMRGTQSVSVDCRACSPAITLARHSETCRCLAVCEHLVRLSGGE